MENSSLGMGQLFTLENIRLENITQLVRSMPTWVRNGP